MTEQTAQSTQAMELLTWFLENWKKVAVAAVAGVVAVAGFYLYNHLVGEREVEASKALTELRATRAPGQAATAEDYRKIVSGFGGTEAARQAAFLAAGALFDAGRYEEARVAFDKFGREHARSPFAAQAAFGVAACLEALKRPDEALAAYQNVVNRYPNDAVSTQAKLALGRLHEAKGQYEAAYKIYQEMTRAGAMSAWQMDFGRRRDELLRRYPQLEATNAPSAAVAAPAPATVPAAPTPPKK